MAKIQMSDCREMTPPTFKDVEIGDMFTASEGQDLYIKIPYTSTNFASYNCINLKGQFHYFDSNEPICLVQEIEISIKK